MVVYDDIDLPLGKLRMREKGSAGTHNGVRSVIGLLGRTRISASARRRRQKNRKAGNWPTGCSSHYRTEEKIANAKFNAILRAADDGRRLGEERTGKRHADGEVAGATPSVAAAALLRRGRRGSIVRF